MNRIAINGGFAGRRITGLQRYAVEVTRRWTEEEGVRLLYPKSQATAVMRMQSSSVIPEPLLSKRLRVLWDLNLPRHLKKDELLWSPCNLGPPIRCHAVTLHDLAAIRSPQWFARGFAAKYRILIPLIVKRCRLIITDCESVRQEICERYAIDDAKVVAIPLGVSLQPTTAEKVSLPAKLAALAKRPYFITLGSIDPRKNLQFVLGEWASYQQAHKDHRLLVIGAHSTAFQTEALSVPAGCEFIGYQPDDVVVWLLQNARALITASIYEGFSFPPLESLALGTPVLISDIPVHRENFNGFAQFFNPTQRGSLLELLEAGNFSLGDHHLLQNVLKNKFNWDVCARATLSALRSVEV